MLWIWNSPGPGGHSLSFGPGGYSLSFGPGGCSLSFGPGGCSLSFSKAFYGQGNLNYTHSSFLTVTAKSANLPEIHCHGVTDAFPTEATLPALQRQRISNAAVPAFSDSHHRWPPASGSVPCPYPSLICGPLFHRKDTLTNGHLCNMDADSKFMAQLIVCWFLPL